MKRIPFAIFFIALSFFTHAQTNDSLSQEAPNIQLSGFIDAYYSYDFNKPETPYRQPFLFNHNRHNETNINLAYVKIGVTHSRYRANLALQAGTYAEDNYAAEQGMLKALYEANVGIALTAKKNLWLDAGIFSSHLGFESAASIDNPTLTRSLAAESSPYFLAGAKLTYNPNEQWEMAAILCNGWQRIQRVDGNSLPGLGTQLVYRSSENVVINWSTFIGTDDPDSTRRMRYFNNFFAQFDINEKLGVTVGLDYGIQQRFKNSTEYENWWVPTLITYYQLSEQWRTALRIEYFNDEDGVIVNSGIAGRFQNLGLSANIDYFPMPNVAFRVEGRLFQNKDAIYLRNGESFVHHNAFITASIAVKIN